MLLSSRLLPTVLPLSPISMYENNNNNHSHQTSTTSFIPPTSLPKYFNVPFAIQHGYFRCIRYLLQLDFDPNERDSQLRTPLILCSYIENDRWSLSLAQNLLEKGAKIALEDHARRNAMHHACALQRLQLVQLYLSCLDFNIEAKDCEGNTCLHYVAITGNCEIAELLIRSAEKLGVRLDQYVNREGCSAAVLALKYGHIECANQITHRDWDEFFIIPRPLSIYETPPTTDDNQTSSTTTTIPTISKKKKNISSNNILPTKTEIRPSKLSFGLLKIIFNDSDTGYSTRLAGLCKQDKQIRHRQNVKHKKQEAPQRSTTAITKLDRTKSTLPNTTHYCSTEALVNERQSSNITKECQTNVDSNGNLNNSNRTSPRVHLLVQQHIINKSNTKDNNNNNNSSFIQKTLSKTQLSIDDINKTKSNSLKNDNEEIKSKISIPKIYQSSNSTMDHSENNIPPATNKLQRPKTAIARNQTFINPPPFRLNSAKIKPINIPSAPTKKKSILMNQFESVSNLAQQFQSINGSESSTYSQAIYAGRPISAAVQRSIPRSNDSACSIREAKGKTCRFNKPEKLFGVRPEELFAPEHQPKILDQRSTIRPNESTRLKRNEFQKQQHLWQQDIDKVVELYNIHHSPNYRKSAVVPSVTVPPAPIVTQTDTLTDLTQSGRVRRMSITKNSSINLKSPNNPKQATFALLNIPRRNSITRPSIKLTNT